MLGTVKSQLHCTITVDEKNTIVNELYIEVVKDVKVGKT